jgi:hypothetical protein
MKMADTSEYPVSITEEEEEEEERDMYKYICHIK